jgi:hypothetical protein
MRRINLLLWPSIQQLDISTMFHLSTTSSSIHMSILYTPVNFKLDTTESFPFASYLDMLLNVDVGGKLITELYDNLDYFYFAIVSFPYISSNIPLSPAYGVYLSQLIRYARTCSAYDQFLSRSRLLTD